LGPDLGICSEELESLSNKKSAALPSSLEKMDSSLQSISCYPESKKERIDNNHTKEGIGIGHGFKSAGKEGKQSYEVVCLCMRHGSGPTSHKLFVEVHYRLVQRQDTSHYR
jgi:hypothetical protein